MNVPVWVLYSPPGLRHFSPSRVGINHRFNPSAISRAPGHSQFGAVPDTRVRVLGEYLILLLSGEEEGWKCGVSALVYYLTS